MDVCQILEGLPDAVFLLDRKGSVRHSNEAASRLLGRRPVPGEHLPPEQTDFVLTRPDGSQRLVRPHSRPLLAPDGSVSGAIVTLTDVTEQTDREAKSAWLSAIVVSSEDAIIGKTLDGIVTSWNQSARRIFGYTADEIVGQSIRLLIPEDRWDEEPLILDRIRRGERVEHFETKRRTKEGRLLDISLTISPIHDSQGNVIGVSKIARNITEQKRIERTFAEERERSRMAIAATRMGTWEYVLTDKSFHCSDETLHIWGAPLTQATNVAFLLDGVHPEDRDRLIAEATAAVRDKSQRFFDAVFRVIRAVDREIRWVRVQGRVFLAQGQKPDAFIGTVLDVTDVHRAHQLLEKTVAERTRELTELNHRLQESNQELEQFAYIASHDLQEPLRKIQVFSEMVEERLAGETPEVRGYFARVRDAAGRMSRLIRDVLEYSRLSASDLPPDRIDLNDLLQEVLIALEWRIAEKGARVLAGDLPPVRGIPSQLRQLFQNIISNALKFSRDEPIIRITAEREPGFVRLAFADNGIGFEQEYAGKIFRIFQRLNRQEDYLGSGIGLAICKKIVDNHGGTITASGTPGEGAIFTVTLPAAD